MKELKEKGKRILRDGAALVDTSGRTKCLAEKSVLAIASKNFEKTILILASEKQRIFNKLKKKHSKERSLTIIHSVKLFYALNGYIETCPAFYICHDGFNKGFLKYYLKQLLSFKYHEQKIKILSSLVPLFGKKISQTD